MYLFFNNGFFPPIVYFEILITQIAPGGAVTQTLGLTTRYSHCHMAAGINKCLGNVVM